jgi:hypothetical protein
MMVTHDMAQFFSKCVTGKGFSGDVVSDTFASISPLDCAHGRFDSGVVYEGGWYVFCFIKKTASYGIEKKLFTLHIPPWAPHTYDFVVLTSLTQPRRIGKVNYNFHRFYRVLTMVYNTQN